MPALLKLEKYSLGVGDRFARQAQAQLQACLLAEKAGAAVIPIWNKSNREHITIGSDPAATRRAADEAVRTLGWGRSYRVDADHIRLKTVDRFVPHADFYTIDVADCIGQPGDARQIEDFVKRHGELVGELAIPGIPESLKAAREDLTRIARRYLRAVQEAGIIYRHICAEKGEGEFITEISMDETAEAQTPFELLVILSAVSDEDIPIQTIAPKFSGRFNKGVDYVGDIAQFEIEFNQDLAVLSFATRQYALPPSLKLSVHSGSDKFSIYGPMRRGLKKFDAGLHIKTAGTTWLEEVIGLAEAGGNGLDLAKDIYAGALEHQQELCGPYAAVIDIQPSRLPSISTVRGWNSEQFVSALRHDQQNKYYNRDLRQLLHVGYKIAAGLGSRYLDALGEHRDCVAKNVTDNLYRRHLKPLFLNGNGA
jgi:hypothetical protein